MARRVNTKGAARGGMAGIRAIWTKRLEGAGLDAGRLAALSASLADRVSLITLRQQYNLPPYLLLLVATVVPPPVERQRRKVAAGSRVVPPPRGAIVSGGGKAVLETPPAALGEAPSAAAGDLYHASPDGRSTTSAADSAESPGEKELVHISTVSITTTN